MLWMRKKYKKLNKKDKKMLENSLKKMGFFILILFSLTSIGYAQEELPLVEGIGDEHPIILPTDQLMKAESSLTGSNILADEDTWRSNTLLFLENNNTNLSNLTNMTF